MKSNAAASWALLILSACSSPTPQLSVSIMNVPEAARCARATVTADGVKDGVHLVSPISGVKTVAAASFVLPKAYAGKETVVESLELFAVPCQEVNADTKAIATSGGFRSANATVQMAETVLSNTAKASLHPSTTPFDLCASADFKVAAAKPTKRSPASVQAALSVDAGDWKNFSLPLLRQTSATQTLICIKEVTKLNNFEGASNGAFPSAPRPTSRVIDWHVAIVDVPSRTTIASTQLAATVSTTGSGNGQPLPALMRFIAPYLAGIDLVAAGSTGGIAVASNGSTLASWEEKGLTFLDLEQDRQTHLDVPTKEASGDFPTGATFVLRSSKSVALFAKAQTQWGVVAGHALSNGSYPRGSQISTDGKWHIGRNRDRVSATNLGTGTVTELFTVAVYDDVARSDFTDPTTLVVHVIKSQRSAIRSEDTVTAHRFEVTENTIKPLDTVEVSGPYGDRAMAFGKNFHATSSLGELKVMDGTSREICSLRGLTISSLWFQSETLLEARHGNATSLIDVARCGEIFMLPVQGLKLNEQDLMVAREKNDTSSVIDIRRRSVLCNLPTGFSTNVAAATRDYLLGAVYGDGWAVFRIPMQGSLCTGEN